MRESIEKKADNKKIDEVTPGMLTLKCKKLKVLAGESLAGYWIGRSIHGF